MNFICIFLRKKNTNKETLLNESSAIFSLSLSSLYFRAVKQKVLVINNYIRHRNAPRNIRDLFQDISNIHSYNARSSAKNNFYTQSSRPSIQLNSFSRIGTTIWNEMPFTLRNLSKYDFSIFCLILTYETSFKRSNFPKLLMYFQNNKYSLNCIIVVLYL